MIIYKIYVLILNNSLCTKFAALDGGDLGDVTQTTGNLKLKLNILTKCHKITILNETQSVGIHMKADTRLNHLSQVSRQLVTHFYNDSHQNLTMHSSNCRYEIVKWFKGTG